MRFLFVCISTSMLFCSPPVRADESTELKQLLSDLKGNEAVKKRKAVKQIATMGNSAKSAVPTLVWLLDKDRDVLVRRGAAEALGAISGDPKPTINALSKAMKDSDVEVIAAASVSLSKYGKQAMPTLQKALTDSDKEVRRNAAEAITKIGPDAKDAVPALLKAYQSEGPAVRRGNNSVKASYVEALGAIGPDAKEAIPVFEKFLEERNADRELRRVVTDALRKIKK